MSLLTVKNLSQTFIDKTLYEDANFVLNKEDRNTQWNKDSTFNK